MKARTLAAMALFAGALAVSGGSVATADCVPEEVDAAAFFVDGELDLEAYLAAVAAANAACAPSGGGALPSTGANTSALLPIALGLTALGGAAVATSTVRRRSTDQSPVG